MTAADNTTVKTYTITVTRAAAHLSTDKTLSALSIANDEEDTAISFNETFASTLQSYTASVTSAVTRITVNATTNHSGASIAYLTGSDSTLVDADPNKDGHQVNLRIGSNEIKLKVTAEDNASTKTYVITVHRSRITTGPATGRPTIGGVKQVGRTLTAETRVCRLSGLFTVCTDLVADPDGIAGDFSFQWIRVNDGVETDINGATSTTYTLAAADLGKKLKVRASFTDGIGNAEARTSNASREIVRRQHRCSSRDSDWCTRLWTPAYRLKDGPAGNLFGYLAVGKYGKGELLDDSIVYRGKDLRVGEVGIYEYDDQADTVVFALRNGWLPDTTVFNIGGTTFEAYRGKTEIRGLYQWPRPSGFRWLDGQFVTVSLKFRPVYLSVSDTEASENNDASLDFEVKLTAGASGAVTVKYATSDGTATAGSDYEATSGQLTFNRGERTKTVSLPIIDDNTDDDGETVNLTLSDATGAHIRGDGTAIGTIHNTEATTVPGITASFSGVPDEHDGSSAFAFTLTFSEDIEGLSYATRRSR